MFKKLTTLFGSKRFNITYQLVNYNHTIEKSLFLFNSKTKLNITTFPNAKSVTVLWNDEKHQAKSVIFNCPETHYKFKNDKINPVDYCFFTSSKWCNFPGIFDIIHNKVTVYLPKNMYEFIGTKRFYKDTNSIIVQLKSGMSEQLYSNENNSIYLTVKTVLFHPNTLKSDEEINEWGAAYVVKLKVDDNHDKAHDTATFIVIDAPSIEYIDSLLKQTDLDDHYNQSTKSGQPIFIIHFTPDKVIEHPKYRNFLSRFCSTTQHIILNNQSKYCGYENYVNNHKIIKLLCPPVQNLYKEDDLEIPSNTKYDVAKFINIDCNCVLTLIGNKLEVHRKMEQIKPLHVIKKDFLSDTNSFKVIDDLHTDYHKAVLLRNNNTRKYPNITFLGTGSKTSILNRSQSCIMVEISQDKIVLLDCGVATWHQMVMLYGKEETKRILRKIRFIFISHSHSDHFKGIFTLLLERLKAFKNYTSNEVPKLTLMANDTVLINIRRYHNIVYNILNQNIKILNLPMNPPVYISDYGLIVKTITVKHCISSFAVSLLYDGIKIVFSGDTMPSYNLLKLGRNCDILIHEATHSDELEQRSQDTGHSTVSQAIKIGKDMNAKEVYLTHISKQLKMVPVGKTPIPDNVAFAFDFMKVHLNDTHILKGIAPAIEKVFSINHNTFQGEMSVSRKNELLRRKMVS